MAAGPVSNVLLMGGHVYWNVANMVAALVINVGLTLLLVPKIGVNGAAIAIAVAFSVTSLAALVEVAWLMRMGTLGRGVAIVAAAAGLCFGGVGLLFRLTVGTSIATFLVFAVVSSTLYALVVLRFAKTLELQVLWDAVTRGRGKRYRGRHRPTTNGRRTPALARARASDAELEAELDAEIDIETGSSQPPL